MRYSHLPSSISDEGISDGTMLSTALRTLACCHRAVCNILMYVDSQYASEIASEIVSEVRAETYYSRYGLAQLGDEKMLILYLSTYGKTKHLTF